MKTIFYFKNGKVVLNNRKIIYYINGKEVNVKDINEYMKRLLEKQ